MAKKEKDTFGFKVSASSGKAAGFSNIPGASSYSINFGKQFSKAFKKAKDKKKVGNAPSTSPATVEAETKAEAAQPAPAKPASAKTTRSRGPRSTGQLGSFSVTPGADGKDQVTTTTKRLTLKDVKSGKYATPIAAENIPESYKPQGTRPSGRQWSQADKDALEAERPRSSMSITQDPPEATAARRAELFEATAPKSRNTKTPSSNKPKKSPEAKSQTSRQFTSGSQDYSNRSDIVQTPQGPAVDLRSFG